MLKRYGLTPETYAARLAAQGGVCAICKKPETAKGRSGRIKAFHIDHDHQCCPGDRSCSKCVRGLLCGRCNIGLGCFLDQVALLVDAANYLKRALHAF